MNENEKWNKIIGSAIRMVNKDCARLVWKDHGDGLFSLEFENNSRKESVLGNGLALNISSPTQQWPSEAERISQGQDPYRGSMQPIARNQQEETTMASKPPIEFTPFHVSIRERLANAWGTTKRYVGTAATVGLVLPWFVPGPHTIIMGLGVAAGVGIAAVTGKKKNKVKIKK